MSFSDMNHSLRVLLVEDNADDVELLVLELEMGGYQVTHQQVDTAIALRRALQNQQWDLILVDYSMPSFSAMQALAVVKEYQLDIPFIIVSGSIGEETAVEAMKAGVHDYILKGKLARLLPAIARELKDYQVRQERRQALKRIERLAFYDDLTDLPNRTLFLECLQECIKQSRYTSELFAVFVLDMDRYKSLKYGFGHEKGYQFLQEVARRLESCLLPYDTAARIGEDSFIILLRHLPNPNEAQQRSSYVWQVLHLPFVLNDSLIRSSASVGIVDRTIGYDLAQDFLRAADVACYNAKRRGVGQTVLFDARMQTEELDLLQLEADLQQAIQLKQFQLYYQPIVCLKTNRTTGFEALIRWQHPTKGWISPAEFIPLAEQSGLISAIGRWVLTEACSQLQRWQDQLESFLPLSMAVNLSGIQLTQPELVDEIQQLCVGFDLNKVQLKLEITESVLMKNAAIAIAVLEQLKQNQVQVCIDDFGTGYSSLAYLHCLPIDILKIDRSFVRQMLEDEKNHSIVRAIIALADALGLTVIAEGVETQAQLDGLRSLNCDYAQGYLLSRPMPAVAVADWLQDFSKDTFVRQIA